MQVCGPGRTPLDAGPRQPVRACHGHILGAEWLPGDPVAGVQPAVCQAARQGGQPVCKEFFLERALSCCQEKPSVAMACSNSKRRPARGNEAMLDT
jgi:hypothetical protein